MRKVIVHISGDYPDSIVPGKTKAVSSLVDAVRDTFDQHIYSINRGKPSSASLVAGLLRNPLKPGFDLQFSQDEDGVTAIRYEGLPAGLYMKGSLSHLADRIADDMIRRDIKPDIIHAHKLTLEGLIAEKLSRRLECPYALSIQVNTDRKIMKYRPDLLRHYRRIYHGASVVFPFSVTGQRVCDETLGPRQKPTVLLPCTSPEDRIIAPQIVEPVLASVFHLRDLQNKNAAALVKASSGLQKRHEGYAFHLYGGGTKEQEEKIDSLIAEHQATSFVRKGPIPHKDVQAMLNGVCGFAMVSKRETFGMVFLEALLGGCPVVFPRDWAIDGFFDDASFALGVSAKDFPAIEAAMERLVVDQSRLKTELSQWQQTGKLSHFQRESVVSTYKTSMMGAFAGTE
ncbi:glycosyltransferase [uncultured Roseibium sp.]|uniref:glycosyltransferase n=1 Tax=uncultured Roseibium sp. TaxID=1936171 RepID=UPI00260F702D|nr:glycosyltransferase [uncultured Roseibium sp.]